VEMEHAVQIGIDKLTIVRNMAKLIRTAETKEDIYYILEKMAAELQEGIDELEGFSISTNKSESGQGDLKILTCQKCGFTTKSVFEFTEHNDTTGHCDTV